MKKITEESVDAFMNARKFKKANMEIEVLPNVSIQQKNWEWFLNGEKWDGDMIDVS